MFRDLKPENVLVDMEGHLRVADFGFAKRMLPGAKCFTMCGSAEYMAPEIVVQAGHGCAADWWALGVITYELKCGKTPFVTGSEYETYAKISEGTFKIPRDPEFTDADTAFIKALLQKDPAQRLGPGQAFTSHAFFEQVKVNWESLRQREIDPKFRPESKPVDDFLPPDIKDAFAKPDEGENSDWRDFVMVVV